MPRNSSGVYTLPAGNPVVTNTTITSVWGNTTMSDIGSELTNSLDRNARGGMLAQLKLVDGSAGTPALGFSNETTSGLYRSAAGVITASILGAAVLAITAAGINGVIGGTTPAAGTFTTINASSTMTGVNEVLTGYLQLPVSASSSTGIIRKGAARWIHDFDGATGGSNFFAGIGAGNFTLTGTSNVGIGSVALEGLTSGSLNVVIGANAGQALTTGEKSVIIGTSAVQTGVYTGSESVIVGYNAAKTATNVLGSVIIGARAYEDVVAADENTIIGAYVGFNGTPAGDGNVIIGYLATEFLGNGEDNVIIGANAGSQIVDGDRNVIIGQTANALSDISDAIIIGRQAGVTGAFTPASNEVIIGNGVTTQVGLNGIVKGLAGTSGSVVSMGGKLHVDTTAVGNVGAGTDDLITYAMPANVMAVAGRAIRITAWGITANNASAKTLTINFGSATLASHSLSGSNAGQWKIEVIIIATGAASQTYFANITNGLTTSSLLGFVAQRGATTQNAAVGITIKCTGAATSNDDIVQHGLFVEQFN